MIAKMKAKQLDFIKKTSQEKDQTQSLKIDDNSQEESKTATY